MQVYMYLFSSILINELICETYIPVITQEYRIAGFLRGVVIFAFLWGITVLWKLIPIEQMCICVLKKSCYIVIVFQLSKSV